MTLFSTGQTFFHVRLFYLDCPSCLKFDKNLTNVTYTYIIECILVNRVSFNPKSLWNFLHLLKHWSQLLGVQQHLIHQGCGTSVFQLCPNKMAVEILYGRLSCFTGFQYHPDGVSVTKFVLEMLYTAQTSQASVHHDWESRTQDLALFHTAKNT